MYTNIQYMAKTRTQRHKFNGGRFEHGNVYYFNKKNVDTLNRFIEQMQRRKGPVIMRHSDKKCTYCKRFEKPWSAIEASASEISAPHSVASLDPWATRHIVKKYPKYPRVNGVPAVVLVDKNGVPIEHTGANTLEDLEKFLSKNGLKLQIVPMDHDNESSYAADSTSNFGPSSEFVSNGAGLGAGLGATGLGPNSDAISDATTTTSPISDAISAATRPISDAISAATDATSDATGDATTNAATTNPNDATASPLSNKIKEIKDTLTKSIDFNNLFGNSADATKTDATQTDANGNKVPQLPSTGGTKRTKRSKRTKRTKRSKRSKRTKRTNRKHRK